MKDKLNNFALSGLLLLSAWTVKTVSDLKAQVAALDARITAVTNNKPPQIVKQ